MVAARTIPPYVSIVYLKIQIILFQDSSRIDQRICYSARTMLTAKLHWQQRMDIIRHCTDLLEQHTGTVFTLKVESLVQAV